MIDGNSLQFSCIRPGHIITISLIYEIINLIDQSCPAAGYCSSFKILDARQSGIYSISYIKKY